MDLNSYFKAIVEVDPNQIVICDLSHTILYMNKKAIEDYSKYGNLIGKSLLNCHSQESNKKILEVINWFLKDKNNNIVHTHYNEKMNKDVYMVALRDENDILIGYYEKHEFRNVDTKKLYDI